MTKLLAALAIGVALAASQPHIALTPATPVPEAAPRVVAVAERLTMRPGTWVVAALPTDCPTSSTASGWGCADIPSAVIHLRPDLLVYLNRLTTGQRVLPIRGALALMTFCHEARHVRGTRDESVAETWAYYHADYVAQMLGASPLWIKRMRPWLDRWTDLPLVKPV